MPKMFKAIFDNFSMPQWLFNVNQEGTSRKKEDPMAGRQDPEQAVRSTAAAGGHTSDTVRQQGSQMERGRGHRGSDRARGWSRGAGRTNNVNSNPRPTGQVEGPNLRNPPSTTTIPAQLSPPSNPTSMEQLLELLNQLEQLDRKVEAFSSGEGSGGAYRGLEERLMRLLCAVDGVEVGRQQTLRDLQKHANTWITKSMRELERKAGATAEKDQEAKPTDDSKTKEDEKSELEMSFELLENPKRGKLTIGDCCIIKADTNEPVPLVTRGPEGELVLEEEALRRVVCRPEVRHRLLAIVSVVGPPRSGKSLLLNLMRDYLAAKGETSDLQIKKESISLGEDRGEEKHEMMLYPEVLLVGDHLAMILVKSTLTEDMLTFSLSTLISSVQIINIIAESNFWEDAPIPEYLDNFAKDMINRVSDKAFQSCWLLVQDKHGVSQGLQGGADLLDDQYASVPGMKNLLHLMFNGYQQFHCFVLPGLSSDDGHSEKLPVLSLVTELVGHVLQPSRLPPKLLGHCELRAHELPSLLSCLVQELQRPDLSSTGLLNALARMEHDRLQCAALGWYTRQVEEHLATAPDPAELHTRVVESLLEKFDQSKIFGKSDVSQEYRASLIQELEANHKKFIIPCLAERETARVKKVKEAADFAVAFYQNEMSSRRPWNVSRSLQDVSDAVYEQAVAKFCERVGGGVTPEEQSKKLGKLKRKADVQCEVLLADYKEWLAEENTRLSRQRLEEALQRALQGYREEMGCIPTELAELQRQNDRARSNAIARFKSPISTYDHKSDGGEFVSKLHKELDGAYEQFKLVSQRQRQEKREAEAATLSTVQQRMVDIYKCEVAAGVENTSPPISHEQLNTTFKTAFERAMQLLGPQMKQQLGEEVCRPYIISAQKEMESIQSEYLMRWIKLASDFVRNSVDQCVETYTSEMQNYLHNNDESSDRLADMHTNSSKLALETLKGHTKSYNLCDDSHIENATEVIKGKYEQFIKMFEKKRAMNVVEAALHDFDEALGKLNPASTTRAALSSCYKEARKQVLDSVRQSLKDSTQLEQDLQQADEHMKTSLANLTTSIEKANLVEVAHEDALATYKSQIGESLECVDMPSEEAIRALHAVAYKRAIEMYTAKAEEGNAGKFNAFLKQLNEDISFALDELKSQLAIKHRADRMSQTSEDKKSYAIGIDLGTTYSCVSVYKDGKVVPIVNSVKKHTTPSVVYFGQHGVQVGEEAKFIGFEDPKNCVSEIKRIIGRNYDDPTVEKVKKTWAFKLIQKSNVPYIEVTQGNKTSYLPEEVSAEVLKELKHQAEVQLGSEVYDAVVTIPAYFTEPQRDATLRACKEAGLNVLRLLNEPTAAAMAYRLQTLTEEDQENKKEAKCHRVLVFDFGGGTCDVSILELRGSNFVVKASRGDNQLGGEDYDDRFTKHIIDKLEKKTPGLNLDSTCRRRLRYVVEIAKCRLTYNSDYLMHLPNFPKSGEELDETVHRNEFEKITADLSERALVPVRECLEEAGLGKDDIELVVLAGGSSRIPKVQQLLMEFFPGKPLYDKINPDEAIACGAALQAALLTGECERAMRITDITPFSLGKGAVRRNNVRNCYDIIIKRNSQIPCSVTSRRATIHDNQRTISVPIYQGENTEDEFKNTLLGQFSLENLTPAPAGEAMADVTFRIDENGILHVTAEEVRPGGSNKRSITITKRVNM